MSTIDHFIDSLAKLIQSTIKATTSVPESINALIELSGYDKGPPVSNPNNRVMQEATNDLLRRMTIIALVGQVAKYQPTSFEDASAMKRRIVDILDEEIIKAADQAEDQSYLMFRKLKSGIVLYLVQKGADLSVMKTVESPTSIPVSVWANKLYQDTGRQEQIISESDVPHPAFMPNQFKVLAK